MEYEVQVEKLAGKGKAIARHEGKAVFIPFGVPGDTLKIETTKQTKSYDEALIKEITTESPHRIKAPCRYFGSCGGCDHQNIEYSELLIFKKELLKEVYRKYIDNNITIEEVQPSPETYSYRNKIHLHGFQSRKYQAWGFYHYQNKKVVNIDSCAIAKPLANKVFQEIHKFLKQRFFKFFLMISEIVIQVNDDNSAAMVTLVSSQKIDAPKSLFEKIQTSLPELSALFIFHRKNKKGYTFKTSIDESLESVHGLQQMGGHLLSVELANLKLELSPLSFFQVNKAVAEAVIVQLEKEISSLPEKPVLLDLFAGVGALSLPLSGHCKMIHAVELVRHAAELAEENAKNNSIKNFSLHQGDAFEAFNTLLENIDEPSKILLIDPPRQGIARELAARIAAGDFQKVLYLSCHPHAQVRDLEIILSRNKYKIKNIQAFDMFPQTHHTEVLVTLERI